jgi:alpha,alpha-trehalase
MMIDAAILDMDGVLTQTATVHEQAWRALFDDVLRGRDDARPLSHDEYLQHIDGKPRMDGLRDFLASRGVVLPEEDARALGEEKDRLFQRLLGEGGGRPFDDAVRAVESWRRHGLGIAFVSASRNARRVLEAAGIDHLCDVRVDGETAAALGLDGKRGIFREAMRLLEVDPPDALVVEDAASGVGAAVEVGAGQVIGLARDGDPRPLLEHGAHRVVRSLAELQDVVEPGTCAAKDLPSGGLGDVAWRIGGRSPALFLDFDGTLAPIVDHPDAAAMDDRMRALVQKLAALCRIVVISGRDRADVEKRVGVEGLWYVGSHGFDIRSPEGVTSAPDAAKVALPELLERERRARTELEGLAGVVVEKKRFALAVHYRMASADDAARAIQVVRKLAEDAEHLRVTSGERVVELRPAADWHKGRAVEQILDLWGDAAELTPVFVGDGRTDEDAFRALGSRGVGVLVGSPRRPTHAHVRVDGVEGVRGFFEELLLWLERHDDAAWSLRYDGWAPEQEPLREALSTLGNGLFATRGAAEEARAGAAHYPGTYLAGGYDRIATEIDGHVLVHEDLVNWPNWLELSFRPAGGEWLSLEKFEVLEHTRELDLRRGVLRRRVTVRDREKRTSRVSSERFVSMADPHVAAIRWELEPLDWDGPIEIRCGLDGTVSNAGVARYRALRSEHLVPECVGRSEDMVWLAVRTRQSRIRMAQVQRTHLDAGDAGDESARHVRHVDEHQDRIAERFTLTASRGRAVRVDKLVVIQSSRDRATSDPLEDARDRMEALAGFEKLRSAHARAWARLWRRYDIDLGSEREEENRILRLHIFHLLQVASPHVVDHDAGVPARGLHGEAYRGHVFWDELFIFPFLNYSSPELTRELLMYRVRRLDAARRIARDLGHQGAAYPWQSGSSGREENAQLHLNPRSNRWLPDETHLQRHIDSAIAWNVWQYYEASGDREFLSTFGAEMLLEIARFWASLATFDEDLQRYRIRGVVGPDEFHTRYPDAAEPGLDDNAYTNVMASWCLRCAERALTELPRERADEILAELRITGEDRARFARIAARLRVVFHDERIISQFDGYAGLRELDWAGYRKRYGDIHRLDRILEEEGDSPNHYKASKQADVLMLFFLFSADELVELLGSMGYHFDKAWIPENVDYYIERTSHGSTLSRVVDAWVLARSHRAQSFSLFQQALRADVADVQGGTTSEGIHLGAMAGSVDIVKRGYTGAVIREGVLWLAPRLPEEVRELRTRFHVRGAWLDVQINHQEIEIVLASGSRTARVGLGSSCHTLERGRPRRFPLPDGRRSP